MLAFGGAPSERVLKLREVTTLVAIKRDEFYRAPPGKRLDVARELVALKARLDALPSR